MERPAVSVALQPIYVVPMGNFDVVALHVAEKMRETSVAVGTVMVCGEEGRFPEVATTIDAGQLKLPEKKKEPTFSSSF